MITAVICERMGWDYWQFSAQPHWFIELLIGKFEIDSKEVKKQQKSYGTVR